VTTDIVILVILVVLVAAGFTLFFGAVLVACLVFEEYRNDIDPNGIAVAVVGIIGFMTFRLIIMNVFPLFSGLWT